MRKFLLYLIIFFGAIGLGYFAQKVKPKEEPLVLTIDTDYVIAYQEGGRFEVILFTNQASHALFQKDQVLRVMLHQESEDIFFELQLLAILEGSKEIYLHETFTRMIFSFAIPYFSSDLYLDEAALSFELFNQDSYLFRLGKFSLLSSYPTIDWTHLSGRKESGVLLSRLGIASIGLNHEMYPVTKVSIGTMHDLPFTHENDELAIEVMHEDYLLYDPAILITLEDESIWLVPNFLYIIDHMLLKESGPLINHYALY